MSQHHARKFFEESLKVLEEERRILLSGNLTNLNKIYTKKTRMSEKITQFKDDLSRSEIDRLKSSTEQNSRYFQAALAGVQTVQKRISAIRDAQKGLSTYGSDGTISTSGLESRSLERRA